MYQRDQQTEVFIGEMEKRGLNPCFKPGTWKKGFKT